MFVTSRIVNHEASSSSWSCPAPWRLAGTAVLYHAALAFTLDIKYSPGRKARGRGRGRGRPAAPAEFRLRRGGQRGRRGGRGGARGPEPAPGERYGWGPEPRSLHCSASSGLSSDFFFIQDQVDQPILHVVLAVLEAHTSAPSPCTLACTLRSSDGAAKFIFPGSAYSKRERSRLSILYSKRESENVFRSIVFSAL